MNTKERIKRLCKENGISVNKLETDLCFGTGYVSKLDKSTPNTKKIQSIADYFKVSVDYLMNGKEPEFSIEMAKTDVLLSNMENRVKEYSLKLAALPKEKQEQIMSLIDMLEG
jgi:transcriptional regulator with XRE-family HTH domain